MLKLFHAATWLLAMTVSVGPGYGSAPSVGPCVVLNQVRMAPMAIDCTVAGSVSRRAESGAFGFLTFRVSHPPARTRAATRPSTSGIRLVRLISRTLLRRSVPGSEADLHRARQRPEVGIRETVKPERVRVARQAGHFGVVPGVARERE